MAPSPPATRASRRPSPSSSSSSTSASSSSNLGASGPGLKTKLVPVYDPSPPKRDAVQRACDACRRNKQKCDGLSPCSRCAGSKRECAYETQNKKNYTRLPTEMGAKQRKRLRWSRVWDEEGDVEVEEEEKTPESSPKEKETVWVKGGKKVLAKETTTRAGRGKKVEFEEEEEEDEIDQLESEGSESEEDEEEEFTKDVVMEEKVECCEELSSRSPPSPHHPSSLPSPPLLSPHPPTAFPPSHPFSTLSLPPTQPHLSPPTFCFSSRLPPRQAISSPPLLPRKISRPHLLTAQSVSSFRSTIVPSPINSTPPPTPFPFSFTSLLPFSSSSSTPISLPEMIIKPPTLIDSGPRKRARTEWEEAGVEEDERRVEEQDVGGVFQDFRFLPPPMGGFAGWSR